jgi:hypothetical protein
VLSQSRTFIDFMVTAAGTAGPVFLPTIDTSGPVPVHTFSGIPVVANQVIYIDPVVATGFDYQITAGDPKFKSVILPTGIGDNMFHLWFWDGTNWFDTGNDLLGGQEFLFGAGGVDRFRITGIETGALLDPFSAGLFTYRAHFCCGWRVQWHDDTAGRNRRSGAGARNLRNDARGSGAARVYGEAPETKSHLS